MHSFLESIFLNHSIIIPAVAGIYRFRKIGKEYFPFIFLMWVGLVNESLSLALIYYNRSNAVNSNFFVLTEYLIVLYQFYKWNAVAAGKLLWLAAGGLIIWLTDNLFINNITGNNSLFRSVYSFTICMLSINCINKILINERGNLLRNPIFIICTTFLFYYGCKAFIESFNAFHIGLSHSLLWNLWIIMYYVNAFSNLFYSLAILCIHRKPPFTLPY